MASKKSKTATRRHSSMSSISGLNKSSVTKVTSQKNTKLSSSSTTGQTATPNTSSSGTKRKLSPVDLKSPSPSKRSKGERRECDICVGDKPATTASFPTIPSCQHDPTVCKTCYQTHFTNKIEDNLAEGWENLDCPLCSEKVDAADGRNIMFKKDAKVLDSKIDKAAELKHPRFLWCPNTGCGQGQIHKDEGNPWVKCKDCKKKICFNHQRLWHAELTCEEFDATNDRGEAEKRDAEELKRITKPCPFCKVKISKHGGCNHMTCGNCKKQWFWSDVAFEGQQRGDGREVADGPERAAPPPPQQRIHLDQAVRAANAEVERQNVPPAPVEGGLPTRINGWFDVLNAMWRPVAIPPTVPDQPARPEQNNPRGIAAPQVTNQVAVAQRPDQRLVNVRPANQPIQAARPQAEPVPVPVAIPLERPSRPSLARSASQIRRTQDTALEPENNETERAVPNRIRGALFPGMPEATQQTATTATTADRHRTSRRDGSLRWRHRAILELLGQRNATQEAGRQTVRRSRTVIDLTGDGEPVEHEDTWMETLLLVDLTD